MRSSATFLFRTGAGDQEKRGGLWLNSLAGHFTGASLLTQTRLHSSPILCSTAKSSFNHIKLQNRLPNPSVGFINDKAVELIFIYITFQAVDINTCKLYGRMSWWLKGLYGHTDNPPDRFRDICCYLLSTREKHNLLSPYFYMRLAFKHVNSTHRPSVL